MHWFKSIWLDYENYKQASIWEQSIRTSTMFFSAMLFWDISATIFKSYLPLSIIETEPIEISLLVFSLILTFVGILLGGYLAAWIMIRFSRNEHLFLLPIFAVTFSLISPFSLVFNLCVAFLFSFSLLILLKLTLKALKFGR